MIYLDSSIIVPALAIDHPNHGACEPLIRNPESVTCTHTLGEAFSVLTGLYRLNNEFVAVTLINISATVRIEPLALGDYLQTLASSKKRGIMGGLVYDALHATVARRLKVENVFTYNLSNFRHVAPDLKISEP